MPNRDYRRIRQDARDADTDPGWHRGAEMNCVEPAASTPSSPIDPARQRRERRLERLIDRLPQRARSATRWLRRPGSRWARIPIGVLLIIGGLLSILPFFGLWMLPIGLLLLAEDIPPFRRGRDRIVLWIARRRPHWLRGRRQ